MSALSQLKSEYTEGFFSIPSHGFLPIHEPLDKLPARYSGIQSIIDNMPVKKHDGSEGYLSIPDGIVEPVTVLEDYYELVKVEEDVFIIAALYRALTFIASAFLLEKAHHEKGIEEKYGQARQFLPKNVSKSLVEVANKLGVYPFLDYHYAYSLGNYNKIDKDGSFAYNNLKMACAFSGKSDESGFIMLHVDIVSHSPQLLKSIWDFNKEANLNSLKLTYDSMLKINDRRKVMWEASNWRNYNDFRVFIMGIKGNSEIFGDGVVYEDCFDNTPQQYRGQSGSQDDIIPTMDIFTGVYKYYPDNVLTRYLIDMRSYRPAPVREFFNDLQICNYNIESFACIGLEGLIYLLAIVNEIYLFRNGHWMFVQKYILSTTRYPVATGGTPITSWLPNQIEAVLNYKVDIIQRIDTDYPNCNDSMYTKLKEEIASQFLVLRNQQMELEKKDYNPEVVHSFNTSVEYGNDTARCPFKH